MSDDAEKEFRERLNLFRLMAGKRYYDRSPAEFVEREQQVCEHERANRCTVLTFEEYQAATGDENEARFVRWEAVRADTEARLKALAMDAPI